MNKGLEESIKGLEDVIKGLEEVVKELGEAILDQKKNINSLKECCETHEIPKPEAPKTDYEYIQDLINDISGVVYNEFKIMTWSASVSVDTFHKPLQHVAYKRYVIKYNLYETSMALLDDYWDIDQVSTKALEQFRFHELLNILMEKLKDAGFATHRYADEHHGLSCGDTHIIEIWRASDIKLI